MNRSRSLAPGARLGAYEIRSPLGAGGMGEVYRATDTHLGRDVAIKVVSEALAADAEHMARFEREARLLAALSHPNVAVIHGIEEQEGIRFLVLELVPGMTLDERLAGTPLPIGEALGLARQIAGALNAAHERGVIHRDLKPANVRVTPEGTAKVLDFGLAKSLGDAGTGGSATATATVGRTADGAVLGTPAYMSPEQARGRPVDARTDIWSFGCVLYEMLTGRRAFGGGTAADCLAAILNSEPDWDALPRATPASIRRLLRRCLDKDAGLRPGAGDLIREIGETLDHTESRRGRRLVGPVLGVLAAVVTAVVVALIVSPRTPPPAPKLSQLTLAQGLELSPSWAPDGGSFAYTAETGGLRHIFGRRFAETEGAPLTIGEHDDIQPAWSPDGSMIAFVRARDAGKRLEPGDVFGEYEGGDVWTVTIATRKEARIVENASNPAFSPDGKRIAVDAAWAGPRRIWITDAAGHNPQQATTDVSEAIVHVRPRWSPDGKRLVFQNIERTKFDVRVIELGTKELVPVTDDLFQNIQPVWSPSGRFIYFTSNRTGGVNLWRVAVTPEGRPRGPFEQVTTGAGQDVEAAPAADGKSLAFTILRQNADLWRLPLDPVTGRAAGAPQEVVSTTREDSRGSWAPDGQSIAFNSDRAGQMNLWLYSFGNKTTRQLTHGPGGDFQAAWSPDGGRIAFFSARAGNADIWSVDVSSGELRQLTKEASIDINPVFSPDGRSIAFQSDRSGRLDVWIMGEDGGAPRQLTRVGVGGHFLRFTKDGRGIVFRCPAGGKPQCLQVPLDGGDPRPVAEIAGGSHISFSPDQSLVLDVVAHKTLWVSPFAAGKPEQVFAFDDPDVRIDYPVWSPDGRWALFDRFRPQGAAIWLLEGLE